MALNKMTKLSSKLAPFATNVESMTCHVCKNDHRYFCLYCNRLQPYCLPCRNCKQPRHFLCTETACIDPQSVDPSKRFTCKYCRPTEKMTEFDDRPPPQCREGSYSAAKLCLAELSKHQKEVLKHRQKPCDKCKQPMPLWRRCFYCCLQLEIACTEEECLPALLDVRINPHWICKKCQDKHEVCPLDVENFCLSCKRDQPISLQCEICSAKFTLACTFPYLCYNTVKLVDKKRLCNECDGPARAGFDVVDIAKCKLVEEEYREAQKKKEKEAAAAKAAAAAQAAREAREQREDAYFAKIRRWL